MAGCQVGGGKIELYIRVKIYILLLWSVNDSKLKSVTNCKGVAFVRGQNRQKLYAGCRSVVWGHEKLRKQGGYASFPQFEWNSPNKIAQSLVVSNLFCV